MGDFWMTSGRSRLKAMEKKGVGKRGQRRGATGGRFGMAQASFAPSTQIAHPYRPKSNTEFLGKKGYVDPFTRRGVVATQRAAKNSSIDDQARKQASIVTATNNPNVAIRKSNRIRVPPGHTLHINRPTFRPPAQDFQNASCAHERHQSVASSMFSSHSPHSRSFARGGSFSGRAPFQTSIPPRQDFPAASQWTHPFTNKTNHVEVHNSVSHSHIAGALSRRPVSPRFPTFEKPDDHRPRSPLTFLPADSFEVKWGGASPALRRTFPDAQSVFGCWDPEYRYDENQQMRSPPLVSASDSPTDLHTIHDDIERHGNAFTSIALSSQRGCFAGSGTDKRQECWVFPQNLHHENPSHDWNESQLLPPAAYSEQQMDDLAPNSMQPRMLPYYNSPQRPLKVEDKSSRDIVQMEGGIDRFKQRPMKHGTNIFNAQKDEKENDDDDSCLEFQTWRGQHEGDMQIQNNSDARNIQNCSGREKGVHLDKRCDDGVTTLPSDKISNEKDGEDEIFHPLEKHPSYDMPGWLTVYNNGVPVTFRNEPVPKKEVPQSENQPASPATSIHSTRAKYPESSSKALSPRTSTLLHIVAQSSKQSYRTRGKPEENDDSSMDSSDFWGESEANTVTKSLWIH